MADVLDSVDFYDLANRVLAHAGRGELTDSSRAIVEVRRDDRALKVVAGPGSGKTEMLVWRVLYDLFVRGMPADRVLVTTFTRKAATELEIRLTERLDQLVRTAHSEGVAIDPPRVQDVRIGTIHALCDRLLSEHDEDWLEAGTRLVDEFETTLQLRRAMSLRLGYGKRGGPANAVLEVKALASLFTAPWEGTPNRLLDKLAVIGAILDQHVETWIPRCAAEGWPNGAERALGETGLTHELIDLHTRWREWLDAQDIIDFANIQHVLVERQSVVAHSVQHAFVDEFQDSNPIQLQLHLGWLLEPNAPKDSRLTVVGDEDQSLYRFRGSDIECFTGFEATLEQHEIATRIERLETNYRSSPEIVALAQSFRQLSGLATTKGAKELRPAPSAEPGPPPRLVSGPWDDISELIAEETVTHQRDAESVAVLLFSTSEAGASAALGIRNALEARNIRAYNPRNKQAQASPSPIHDLLGFISYFLDPVVPAAVGKGGRAREAAASMDDDTLSAAAPTVPPAFRPPSPNHLACQKRLRKRGTKNKIGHELPHVAAILEFLDDVRERVVTTTMDAEAAETRGEKPRRPVLTLAGLVARILKFEHFRACGYTIDLFRQAAFTGLLESAVATTRRTMRSLDAPLQAHLVGGKVSWDDRYWNLLSTFGEQLSVSLDDQEVEAFEDAAVPLITFHQAKGLEFDHVYVGLTGREPSVESALRSALFSGRAPDVSFDDLDGTVSSNDPAIRALAEADKARELFVAVTRAKRSLTIVVDPGAEHPLSSLDPRLQTLFESADQDAADDWPTLTIKLRQRGGP